MGKNCAFPACPHEALQNSPYCYSHGRLMAKTAPKKKEEAVVKPIKHFSEKREKLQREYRKQVSEALAENNECEVKSPVCIREANGFQHIQKRTVKNLMIKKNQKRCCAACQTWIEENPELAIQMGVSVSKFDKDFLSTEPNNAA